jgi:hypothetical protein
MLGIIRKPFKAVLYTAIPIAGPLKAVTMGTRAASQRSKKELKEMQKQTEILERMERKGL